MDGDPVWLASISHKTKTTDRWTAAEMATAQAKLLRFIEGRGDPARQRIFRMCVTLCLHRALTAEERARLPASFHEAEAIDIAGGPVEILSETVPGRLSTRPCESPEIVALPPGRLKDVKFHADCGECPPCLARKRA